MEAANLSFETVTCGFDLHSMGERVFGVVLDQNAVFVGILQSAN
jgi:hypothetical protein